ncbi:MAG: rhodanese-like domain-containing protein [Pirellulales bacterium]|nr:rhodanese-like domain-containing protein [Pirellulales bacterium]
MAIVAVAGSVVGANGADSDNLRVKKKVASLLPREFDWGGDISGPLCGVYAACTALELLGIEANPRNFIASRYVGQCGGSAPEEVSRVVVDAGAHAHTITRLSAIDLRLINCPVIANVRISASSNRFNHWIVAFPSDNGMTIYDGLQQPYDIRTAEFLGSWSGIGICVSRSEASPLVPIWLGRSSLFLIVGIAGVCALRNQALVKQINESSILKLLGYLCIASGALCIAGSSVFGDLLNHGKGVAVATASSQVSKYRVGTLEDAEQASVDPNALLIDARREQDYQLGTINRAVNVPVTASTWAIHSYLEKIDRDTPIVVFCQSARCDYDETVGAQLASLGFSDVTICNEGWSEFKKSITNSAKQ